METLMLVLVLELSKQSFNSFTPHGDGNQVVTLCAINQIYVLIPLPLTGMETSNNLLLKCIHILGF
jgi:hypothetical protein